MSAQPYLTDSVRYFRFQGPLARHLLRAGRDPVSRFHNRFGPLPGGYSGSYGLG